MDWVVGIHSCHTRIVFSIATSEIDPFGNERFPNVLEIIQHNNESEDKYLVLKKPTKPHKQTHKQTNKNDQ